ncbi:Uncharacterised protein [Serratia proteamaculans]|nr:Uncharacterised protein [Serratia proteamaculans]
MATAKSCTERQSKSLASLAAKELHAQIGSLYHYLHCRRGSHDVGGEL